MNTDNRETLKALVELAKKATPGPWTKIGSAKRTLFTTAQGQQQDAPDKAFLPVEIVTCLRHAEQAHADCDFIAAARNAIPALEALLQDKHMQIPESQWRTIESAPQDGRRILLAWPDGEVREAWWHSTTNPPCALWRTDSGRPVKTEYPKSWMPLPAPPNGDEG